MAKVNLTKEQKDTIILAAVELKKEYVSTVSNRRKSFSDFLIKTYTLPLLRELAVNLLLETCGITWSKKDTKKILAHKIQNVWVAAMNYTDYGKKNMPTITPDTLPAKHGICVPANDERTEQPVNEYHITATNGNTTCLIATCTEYDLTKQENEQPVTIDAEYTEKQEAPAPLPQPKTDAELKAEIIQTLTPCPKCGSKHKPYIKNCKELYSAHHSYYGASEHKYYRLKCRDCGHTVKSSYYLWGMEQYGVQNVWHNQPIRALRNAVATWGLQYQEYHNTTAAPASMPALPAPKPEHTEQQDKKQQIAKALELYTLKKNEPRFRYMTHELFLSKTRKLQELRSLADSFGVQWEKHDTKAVIASGIAEVWVKILSETNCGRNLAKPAQKTQPKAKITPPTAPEKQSKGKTALTRENVNACSTRDELVALFSMFKKDEIAAFMLSIGASLRGLNGLGRKQKLISYCANKIIFMRSMKTKQHAAPKPNTAEHDTAPKPQPVLGLHGQLMFVF